ncbi:MAG: hypothetical protein ABI763_15465 [Bacteroidota bacterium]
MIYKTRLNVKDLFCSSQMEEKMKHMTPQQREEFRKKWQHRCGPKWNFPEENKTESGNI